ncbi:Phosphoglucomutase-1 [Tyrophagus putrescentiae]|nr:Phosphoglucomutase-1 [Tyrophagus putrescentiae]
MVQAKVITVETSPFEGQKPGTSGLRKPVATFMQPRYTENFVQAILDVALAGKPSPKEVTLVVGGDGRYFSKPAIEAIIGIAAGNGVGRLLVAQNGIMSTPAVSSVIRALKADGGIILTASHNPGGPQGDFGIKYNCDNGGPAPDNITNQIFAKTKELKAYRTLEQTAGLVDLANLGKTVIDLEGGSGGQLTVEVIDSVEIYLQLLKTIFDFGRLKDFLASRKILIDAMNGVMGPYVKRILVEELGAPAASAIRCTPLEDFGGDHPDPNLTYAADLVAKLTTGDYDFGAAFDGDGDRNMILGRGGFFVTPSDSLAVLADHLEVIPYFSQRGVSGYARSMPTSRAVDLVAAAKGIAVYETPTGWKYFGNLMDAGAVAICGEESFGTGSDHIREKDGLWAVLAWLSVLASASDGGGSVEALLKAHWRKYGRYFYSRYDYENCEAEPCSAMMAHIRAQLTAADFTGKGLQDCRWCGADAFDYAYTNHLTGETESAGGHGLVVLFNGGAARAIFRLSGTGSSGATVRLYLEQHEPDGEKAAEAVAAEYVKPLAEVALAISNLAQYTGRQVPTVIT